jgi:dTDP-4-amino-4,6-dideoxygalactose transaminase
LGGTTSAGDCVHAASFLVRPHRLVRGPSLLRYELEFAKYVGARYGYSFSSGRVALFGILRALDVGEGDEVILQVPTHIVVANAIRYLGARPVFVDSDLATCNMSMPVLERAIGPRTRVIVLQHTFGAPADIARVLDLADKCGVSVIEDCVHSLGATLDGKQVGSFGRAAFFSTEETKTISTTMGGMAVTNDDELAVRLAAFQRRCALPSRWLTTRYLAKLVSYHVLTEPHLHRYTRPLYEALGRRNPLPGPTTREEIGGAKPPGYERRLANAQAALGLRQLRRIKGNLAHRALIAEVARRLLRARGFEMPQPHPGTTPAYLRVPVYVQDRPATVEATARHSVLGTWFTSVLEEAVDPSVGGYVPGSCPAAEWLSTHLVNIPTHPRTSVADVAEIVAALSRVRDSLPIDDRAAKDTTTAVDDGAYSSAGSDVVNS